MLERKRGNLWVSTHGHSGGSFRYNTLHRRLIRANAITGVPLVDGSSIPFVRDSCEQAKSTRKVIRKERQAPLAEGVQGRNPHWLLLLTTIIIAGRSWRELTTHQGPRTRRIQGVCGTGTYAAGRAYQTPPQI